MKFLHYFGYAMTFLSYLTVLLFLLPFIGFVKQPTWQLARSSLRSNEWNTEVEEYRCSRHFCMISTNIKNGFKVVMLNNWGSIETNFNYETNVVEKLILNFCFEYKFFKCQLDHELYLQDKYNKCKDKQRQKIVEMFKETK